MKCAEPVHQLFLFLFARATVAERPQRLPVMEELDLPAPEAVVLVVQQPDKVVDVFAVDDRFHHGICEQYPLGIVLFINAAYIAAIKYAGNNSRDSEEYQQYDQYLDACFVIGCFFF